MNSKHWANISKEGKDFVKALLNSNPAKRLGRRRCRTLDHQSCSARCAAFVGGGPITKKYADANRFEKAIRQMATHPRPTSCIACATFGNHTDGRTIHDVR